jgi:hypothetical protein
LTLYASGCAVGEAAAIPAWVRFTFAEAGFLAAILSAAVVRRPATSEPAAASTLWRVSVVLLTAAIVATPLIVWKA